MLPRGLFFEGFAVGPLRSRSDHGYRGSAPVAATQRLCTLRARRFSSSSPGNGQACPGPKDRGWFLET